MTIFQKTHFGLSYGLLKTDQIHVRVENDHFSRIDLGLMFYISKIVRTHFPVKKGHFSSFDKISHLTMNGPGLF